MTQQEFEKRYTYHPDTDRLGEGGFGEVFKAYDNYRDRWIAIKIAKVKPGLETVRLKKEVEMVNKLPLHPNIAYYEESYTFSSFAGEYDFGILQFYESGNLQQLAEKSQLSLQQKESILTQLLEGIAFLHEHGIIHRDLKPANILMVNRNGEFIPKITDFGISKQLDINKSSVFSNSLAGAGTLSFASPEQLADRNIRKNTDLWSFGVIACWLLTGKLPFTTGSHATTSEAGRAELFRQINACELPAALKTLDTNWQNLIKSCLVVDAENRIKKAEEGLAMLQGQTPVREEVHSPVPASVAEETEIRTKPQPAPKPQTPKPVPISGKTNKTLFWGFGILALVLIGLVLSNIIFQKENAGTENEQSNSITKPEIEWVSIPAGTFIMGCSTGEVDRSDDEIQHQVSLSAFKLSKYEVTFAQYDAFCDASGRQKPADEGWGRGNQPVINVSWDDAKAFALWMGCRLPTEAEWEYACRAGTTTPFNTGNCLSTKQANYDGVFSYYNCSEGEYRRKTLPVGSFAPNAWGLYDMHGNVWEWCSDWYGKYQTSATTNPKGPASGSDHVCRGGSWSNYALDCRSAFRNTLPINTDSDDDVGFRLASSL